MEKVVLTQEELDVLKTVQEQGNQLINGFGQIEVAFTNLDVQKASLKQALAELKEKETEFGKSLQEKYGNGNINIETGEFTKVD